MGLTTPLYRYDMNQNQSRLELLYQSLSHVNLEVSIV
jgi:hypothetical protein